MIFALFSNSKGHEDPCPDGQWAFMALHLILVDV